jgi:hypothetical protein
MCRASRSEERPNCIRRSLAIWSLSFSISRVRSWTASFAGKAHSAALLAGSDRGGERAAAMFTLIETAKLNGLAAHFNI